MKQRIITFSKRFTVIDSYGVNFDEITKGLNSQGWIIKQIVSTSFNHQLGTSGQSYPILIITILIEKMEE